MRVLLAGLLLVLGLLACALGVLIWASSSRSDTATSELVVLGLAFALPGAAATAAGAWLLRRRG